MQMYPSTETESTIRSEIAHLSKDLVALEIQLELSKVLGHSRSSASASLERLSPKIGLRSQLDLNTVELGLLADALEVRYDHQFTLGTLFIRHGEPVSDISIQDLTDFICGQLSLSAPRLVRVADAENGLYVCELTC